MPAPDSGARRPLGPSRRSRPEPPDSRTISRLIYIAVAVIAVLLLYVAIRSALH